MKDEIKKAACKLLIEHGYRGFGFAAIADSLDMTRANIHYHFGTKSQLIDEVISDYVDRVVEVLTGIWTANDYYADKVLASMEFNRSRYLQMNPPGLSSRPWSLISRMRLESALLSSTSLERLRRFSVEITDLIGAAVEAAHSNGEFSRNAPLKDITLQIVIIIDSAGSLTMDAGSFARLEHLYLAHLRLVSLGYGARHRPDGDDGDHVSSRRVSVQLEKGDALGAARRKARRP